MKPSEKGRLQTGPVSDTNDESALESMPSAMQNIPGQMTPIAQAMSHPQSTDSLEIEPELPSLFSNETIKERMLGRSSYSEEKASGLDAEEVFIMLDAERSALSSQCMTLRRSISSFNASLKAESSSIDSDLSALEKRFADSSLLADPSARVMNQNQLLTQMSIMRQNRRMYIEKMSAGIRDMEISLAEKEKDLALIDSEIKMILGSLSNA